ncbi:MAG: hypothetical protein M1582_04485 [Actinobacteria bacterium]|nr:hypothetical protein [Actinomycetota bacterium]
MGLKGSRTEKNILTAFAGESQARNRYTYFAGTARNEGYVQIADIFEAIAVAEKQHEKRYRALQANVENGSVFKKPQPVTWRCRNCGYIHEGPEAPAACPACAHPRAQFEMLAENY